jgi:hypothetical protein
MENWRGDPERGFVLGGLLSTSQFISVLLVGLAIVLFFRLKPRAERKAV